MIKITLKQLIEMGACQTGIDWFVSQRKRSLNTLIPALLEAKHRDYAGWLLSRLLTHSQKAHWAFYAAEQVLEIFENEYPDDQRPRQAIKAAKYYLTGKITPRAVYAAADAAAYAADAAADAADAAAYAAYAAYAAANSAADSAAYASNSAADAAAYAADAAAYAAYAAVESKIYSYALILLGE